MQGTAAAKQWRSMTRTPSPALEPKIEHCMMEPADRGLGQQLTERECRDHTKNTLLSEHAFARRYAPSSRLSCNPKSISAKVTGSMLLAYRSMLMSLAECRRLGDGTRACRGRAARGITDARH